MRRFLEWWKRNLAREQGRLIAINDTPHSVALGASVGMFFGFTPLFGLKTLLSILCAWVFRSNKLAAAITVTLHDLILPFVPVMLLWQYKVGTWVLHGHLPKRTPFQRVRLRDYMEWTTFFTLGQPTLVGSLFLALPAAVVTYFLVRGLLLRARVVRNDEPKAP